MEYLYSEHRSEIEAGRLIVYTVPDEPGFRISHAKNTAARCGILEDADIIVTLDADNLAGYRFEDYIQHKFKTVPWLSYLCPDFGRLPPAGKRYNKHNPEYLGRGFMGRLAIRANDFIKAGGYNEKFAVWGSEDIDLLARLDRIGFVKGILDDSYLNAIAHGAYVRFREYPEAERFENGSVNVYHETRRATDTVVNYGRIGCGVVSRNHDPEQITLAPVPTRIFGIGMQRTATSSLHQAFQALGYDSAHWRSGHWALAIWREMHRWGHSVTLEREYALCDNPIPLLFENLDKAYPNSKFILTVRDEADWLRSVQNFWTYEGNPQRWTWDGDPFSHKVHGITYGQVTFDAEVFLTRYRKHIWDVLTYFRKRPDDLLVMNMSAGAGWTDLCGFLGVPVPSVPYPRANALVT